MLVCAATLFSVGTRLASLLGYQKFLGEDDFSADFIDEGKALMKRGLCTCTLSVNLSLTSITVTCESCFKSLARLCKTSHVL